SSVSHISLCDLNAPTEIYTLSLHDALPIWEPSEEQINEANVTAYMKWLQDERNLSFNTYAELWKWSTDEVEMFWESLWEYFEITSETPYDSVLSTHDMPGGTWFNGAMIIYIENVFKQMIEDHQTFIHVT